jgi:hypothetical protein
LAHDIEPDGALFLDPMGILCYHIIFQIESDETLDLTRREKIDFLVLLTPDFLGFWGIWLATK